MVVVFLLHVVPTAHFTRPEWPPQRNPEDPILKKINLTIGPKSFSIILKTVNLEAKNIIIMINIVLVMILVDIGQYWFQILIMILIVILIIILVNIDRGDPVEFLWISCGV